MCFAVIEVKYKMDKEPSALKRIASKEALEKEQRALEQIGTVASVTTFYNHHTRRLVEAWQDEMYKEPETKVIDIPPMKE
jgi:hypothetical protein